MKTLIDNTQKVFLLQQLGFSTRKYFCNLSDIPNIIKNEIDKNEEFTISEYWNFKFKKCSKKHLNEMFEANQIDFNLK